MKIVLRDFVRGKEPRKRKFNYLGPIPEGANMKPPRGIPTLWRLLSFGLLIIWTDYIGREAGTMAKRFSTMLMCFVALTISVSTLHGQDSKKITLSDGEMVWDLNGEWDVWIENYGPSAHAGSYRQIVKITQTGASFVAIRMIDDPFNQKGAKQLEGELDKSGIKQVTIFARIGSFEAKGQISDEGKKIVIDNGIRYKLTFTRR
jgi:hypothetical protein